MRAKQLTVTLFGKNRLSPALRTAQKDIKSFGATATRAGRGISVGVSAPIALMGAGVIKASSDFEAAMNRVRGVSRATEPEVEALTNKAKELGSTTQFSASETAAAMEELARAGLAPAEILEAIGPTLQLAASSSIELADAAGISAGSMKGWRKEAKDLTDINDVLVNTNLRTKSTLTSLSEGMAKVAPIAASMGLEINEVSAALGILQDNQIEGSESGVSLKTILGSLANVSPEAARTLQGLGVDRDKILDSSGNVKSITALIEELERTGAGATEMFQVFGKRGAVGIAALVGAGSQQLVQLSQDVTQSGAAAEQAAIRMEGAEGAMKGLTSAGEGLAIAVGDSGLLEDFTGLVNWMAELTREASNASPWILRVATVVGLVGAVLGPVLIGIGFMATGISALIPVFAGLASVVTLVFGVAFSPLGLVLAGVAGLAAGAYLLIENWAGVSTFFSDLWGGLKQEVLEFTDVLPDFVKAKLGIDAGGSLAAPPAAAAGQTNVGGKVTVELAEGLKPKKVASDNPDVDIDVTMGPLMAFQ